MRAGKPSSLIVGASGFLGGYVAAACHAREQKLLGISSTLPRDASLWNGFAQGDLQHIELDRFLDGHRLDACYILSGGASVADSMLEPARDFGKLLPGIANLLAYLVRKQKDCHILLFSSAAVYGNPVRIPIYESSAIAPLSPYGAHKWLAEEMVRRYSEIYGLHASILRIFSAYGTGLQRQLFWDLARKYEEAIRKRTFEIALSGTGLESRDFIHAADVAGAALLIASRGPTDGHQTCNVANGVSVSIKDAASILLSLLSKKVALRFSGQERRGDPHNWQADVGKLRTFGYRQSVDLKSGLQGYVEWLNQLEKDVP